MNNINYREIPACRRPHHFPLLCAMIIAALTALLPTQSAYGQDLSTGSYRPGESLTYTISYRAKLWPNTDVGRVTFTISEEQRSGEEAWKVEATAKTFKLARMLFKLDDTFSTWLAEGSGLPLYFSQEIHEGDYRTSTRYDYDWGNQRVVASYRKYDRPFSDKELALTTNDLDPIAHFYALRNQDITGTLRAGSSRDIGIILNDTIRHITYTYMGPERRNILGIGEVATLKFSCQLALANEERLEDGNLFYIWLSDDPNHIPLYIETPTRYGLVRARLTDYSGLKYPFRSVLLNSKLAPK